MQYIWFLAIFLKRKLFRLLRCCLYHPLVGAASETSWRNKGLVWVKTCLVLFDGAERASTTTQFQFSVENSNAALHFPWTCAFPACFKLLLKSRDHWIYTRIKPCPERLAFAESQQVSLWDHQHHDLQTCLKIPLPSKTAEDTPPFHWLNLWA